MGPDGLIAHPELRRALAALVKHVAQRRPVRISLAQRRAIAEPLEFSPTRLNITSDDRTLVLQEDDETLWVYEIETSQLKFSLDVGL